MENIINYYNNKINKMLNDNKSKLIEAFVIYYGEEYRDFITNKFNEMNFCWGISNFFKKSFQERYKKIIESKPLQLLNQFERIKSLCEFEDNNLLGFSNDNINKYSNLIKNVINSNSKITAYNGTFLYKEEIVKFIYFDMFLSSDQEIIHEINHYITNNVLATLSIYDKNFLVSTSGVSSFGNEKVLFEELLNEISSMDIVKIFKSLGGNLTWNKELVFTVSNKYKKFLPLVESFYTKYKDILKEVRMSENTNLLYKYVDKDIYLKYIKFIDECDKIYKGVEIPKEHITLCDSLCNAMVRNVKKI